MTKIAEAPTARDLRSVSDVVKKAGLGFEQHNSRACTLEQVAMCREMNGESGLPWPVEMTNRQRWVKEWSSDRFYRKTVENDLYAVPKRLVDAMHHTYGEANDSLESE